MGRRQKPYQTSWKEVIAGLAHDTDGKWRIVATGQKFRESDERKAVTRARGLIAAVNGTAPLLVSMEVAEPPTRSIEVVGKLTEGGVEVTSPTRSYRTTPAEWTISDGVSSQILWPWLRDQLLNEPEWLAKQVNLPSLAKFADAELPRPDVRLSDLLDNYRTRGTASEVTKGRVAKVFGELTQQTGAKVLDQLTTEKLLAFREWVETNPSRQSGSYKVWYYGAIKTVVGFGLKTGIDAAQVTAALARCKVLWSSTAATPANPTPISRDDIHALLTAATPVWRAMILVGLNSALHLEEVCALEWAHLDLTAGTYATIRNKTKADRIPRAAVLWPETVAALLALPCRNSPYVFVSPHGTRYNRSSRGNKFASLRERAEVAETVTYDWIKDGAYTAAINDPAVEERFARVLAGHKSPGLQDNYVLRNPTCVKPACDAVYRAYGPFPSSGNAHGGG